MILATVILGTLAASAQAIPAGIAVRRPPEIPAEARAWRAALAEGRPALRGFRAPILDRRGETAPIDLPADPAARRAAAIVARDLARAGLLATTAAAVESLGGTPALADLERVGIPVDWLEFFRGPDGAPAGADAIVRAIAGKIGAGASAESLRGDLAAYSFEFRASLSGFEVATESGENPIGTLRLQLTGGTYWTGPGDGGCLDLARQLVEALPDARFVASVEETHLAELLETARSWPFVRPDRFTVIPEPRPVAQWAQDDGKPGFAPAAAGVAREVVTLVPRYASRGEDGAAFIPGETFAVDGLAAAGLRAVQSPLLFQGGDLLAARDPRQGERLLFVGEANVWRNTALGLTREQVLEAFRTELGVDRCIVLPAVSFHVDQELSLRGVGDRLVVFVPDPVAAVKSVLSCGIDALERAAALDASSAAQARSHLGAGLDREFLALVFPKVGAQSAGPGRYPEAFASAFSSGAADSGVGNLQRFLLALDLLVSWTIPLDGDLPLDPHSIAYLRSFRRRDDDRRAMVAELRRSGLEIVRVPSLPEGSRGIDYLNGVHEPGRYLMPAWGGLFAPLDRAAAESFRARLGPGIEVREILTGESQRRGGALHCSISALPGP